MSFRRRFRKSSPHPSVRRLSTSKVPFWVSAALGAVACAPASAQIEREYFMRTAPYPPYPTSEASRYNIKVGKATAYLSANVQGEWNDNIFLNNVNKVEDYSIGPYLGIGIHWPITKKNVLELDLGAGYRWYLNSPDVSAVNVTPNTHLDYTILVDNLRILLRDRFAIHVDPLSYGQLSGGGAANFRVTDFRRLINTAGIQLSYQLMRDLGVYAGYDYTIDRTLTSGFKYLDRDEHTLYGGVTYDVNSRLQVGVGASYSLIRYVGAEPGTRQNDGTTVSIGPNFTWRASKTLTVQGSVGYTFSSFENNGTFGGVLLDATDYSGWNYSLSVRHMLTPNTTHYVRLSQGFGAGILSNFTDQFSVQYGITTMITKSLSVNGIFGYETFEVSGGPFIESADRYLFYVGLGYQFSRHWSTGVSYSYAMKRSNLAVRDYDQNRVTLDLTRRF